MTNYFVQTVSFNDSNETVWDWKLWPLWLCFILVGVVPFLSIYRVGPLASFYLEATSLLGALLLLFLSAITGRLNVKLPLVSQCLFVWAIFWWAQARIMGLTYHGMNDMVVWTFIILALAVWSCKGWIAEFGQNRVVSIFAWAVVIGATIQAIIAVMQFTGWAGWSLFRGIIGYYGLREVRGQLGQRNHLGHYLMWGILAASYLWSQRRMPAWLGLLLLVVLTSVLGLVNSRTILIYVVGVGVLLIFWWFLAGRKANRLLAIILLALVLTVLVQFSIGNILNWLTNVHYDTAIARVGNSHFAQSARDIEWHKAWMVWKQAPWFGYGWGGYSLQGFLANDGTHLYNLNSLNVLFTHTHNIVLQLLVEIGLVGTLLVVVGFIVSIARMLMRPAQPASLLLLCMMMVSLCHSMLEYPLWYVYFLTPFILMMGLGPVNEHDKNHRLRIIRFQNIGGVLIAILLMIGLGHLTWVYGKLVRYDYQNSRDTVSKVDEKVNGLIDISKTESLLRYYAEFSLSRRANSTGKDISPLIAGATKRALTFRPYSNTYQIGFYEYQEGNHQKAQQWLQKTYQYYPYLMSFYAGKILNHSQLNGLYQQVKEDCDEFLKIDKKAKPCTKS